MATLDPGTGPESESSRTVAIDADGAGELFDALSSATAREILTALYERPRTASAVADAVDTSVQNVHHHFDQLREADLIAVTGTRRSAQGREMKVHAPAADGLVLFAGAEPGADEVGEEDRTDCERIAGLALFVAAGVALWRYFASR